MTTAIAVALRPNNEATRPTRSQRGKRVTTIFVNSSNPENSALRLQMQRLQGQFGLSEVRAALVAALAFGGDL